MVCGEAGRAAGWRVDFCMGGGMVSGGKHHVITVCGVSTESLVCIGVCSGIKVRIGIGTVGGKGSLGILSGSRASVVMASRLRPPTLHPHCQVDDEFIAVLDMRLLNVEMHQRRLQHQVEHVKSVLIELLQGLHAHIEECIDRVIACIDRVIGSLRIRAALETERLNEVIDREDRDREGIERLQRMLALSRRQVSRLASRLGEPPVSAGV